MRAILVIVLVLSVQPLHAQSCQPRAIARLQAMQFGMRLDATMRVVSVVADGAAQRAGVRVGDVVQRHARRGDEVTFAILRDGEPLELRLALPQKPR